MATFSAQGTLPASGAEILAAPLTDTFNHIMNTLNGNNLDENNVDYTSADGIVTKQNAQPITGQKDFQDITAAGAGVKTISTFTINPASGTVSDNDGGEILFQGDNDAAETTVYGEIEVVFTDVSDGTEDADMVFKTMIGGTSTEVFRVGVSGIALAGSTISLGDDDKLEFGAGTDYWFSYDSAGTNFELRTTDSDGAGADSDIMTVQDGTNDVAFSGGISTDGAAVPTSGITAGGSIISDTDSLDDLGATGTRWANLYVDDITTTTSITTGGTITSGGNIVSDTDSTDDLGTTGVRWANVYTDSLTSGTAVVTGGSITDTSGAISFGNENLTTTGTLSAGSTTVTALSLDDSQAVTLGTGNDATIQYDGTNLNINPDAVGSGRAAVLGNASVGLLGTEGTLHVHTASAGSVTANTAADDLVVESDDGGGISIITPDANSGMLRWTSPSGTDGIILANYNSGSPYMAMYTGTTEHMRIDSSGVVGIGATPASADKLYIYSSAAHSDAMVRLLSDSASATGPVLSVDGDASGVPALVVADGSGMVVGHTAQLTVNGQVPEVQVLGTTSDDSRVVIGQWVGDSNGPYLQFVKSRDTTIGSFTKAEDNDSVGRLRFIVDDGLDYNSQVAMISVEVDGATGNNDTPGRIEFHTTADGSASPTERMRIDSDGLVDIKEDCLIGSNGNGALLYLNDSANANLSNGITINQGGADDEILAFKSSDVAHGMTGRTETDTYGAFAKHAATSGGLGITGYNDADGTDGSFALVLTGRAGETADTTDTSSSDGVVAIRAQKKSGTSSDVIGSTENLLSIDNANTTRLILKGNGDMHITNTTLTALDGEDDVALIRAAQHVQSGGLGMAMDEWDESLCANEEDLRRVGVIRGDFLNVQRYQSLLGGGIVQVWKELRETSKRLESAESKLALLEA